MSERVSIQFNYCLDRELGRSDQGCRVVGPGGIGNTRLALAVSERLAGNESCWGRWTKRLPLCVVTPTWSILPIAAPACSRRREPQFGKRDLGEIYAGRAAPRLPAASPIRRGTR